MIYITQADIRDALDETGGVPRFSPYDVGEMITDDRIERQARWENAVRLVEEGGGA